MGRYLKNPEIGNNAFGITIPNVTTAQRPSGVNGQLIYNTTTSTYQSYIGAAWYNVSTAAGEKTLTIDRFQGDGSSTVFGAGTGNTVDGSTAATFSQTVNDATDILVFVGGVYQIPTTNYSVSGQQITFGSLVPANDGASNGHIITIIHGLHKLGA
jgi:hypothetical protein